MKTYGSSSKRQDEADKFDLYKDDQVASEAGAMAGWDLPATLRNDFAQHDPTPMFLEPSSTVPDNTMSQQRLIQEALAVDGMTLSHNKGDQSQPSESSIPWSAYLTATQMKSPATQAKSSLTQEKSPATQDKSPIAGPKSSIVGKPVDDGSMMGPPEQPTASAKGRSQTLSAHPRSTHTTIQSSPVRNATQASIQSPTQPNTAKALQRTKTVNARSSSDRKAKQATQRISEIEVLAEGEDEAVQNSDPPKKAATAKSNSSRGNEIRSETGNPSSDDLIGFPKEQYVPRPSRRRTIRAEAETITPSQPPEATARAKRRKTNHEAPLMHEQENIEAIVNMGFSPQRAKAALNEASGNIERAVGILTASPSKETKPRPTIEEEVVIDDVHVEEIPKQGEIEFEKADQIPPKSTLVTVEIPAAKSSPVKQTVEVDTDLATATVQITESESPSIQRKTKLAPSTRRSVKPSRSHTTAAIPSKKKTRKILDSDDDSEMEISPVAPKFEDLDDLAFDTEEIKKAVASKVPQDKKRGRGRPRKSDVKAPVPVPSKAAEAEMDELADDQVHVGQGQSEAANGGATDLPEPEVQHADKSPEKAKPPASTPQQQMTERVSKATPQKEATTKKAASHSPINKSKVPLRVGLSRRMRIPSLLKIVKK